MQSPGKSPDAATWFPWTRALVRRLVPKSRYARIFLTLTLAAAVAAWCFWYKPWQAHYRGLPSSYWAGILVAEHQRWSSFVSGTGRAAPAGYLAAIQQWLSATFAGGPEWGPDFEKVLKELLHHPDAEVRRVAAVRLCACGSYGWRLALPILLDNLRTHPDPEARGEIASVIRSISSANADAVRPAVAELLRCHEAETDQSIRNTIVEALRNLDLKSADWPPLVQDIPFDGSAAGATLEWRPLPYTSRKSAWSPVVDPTAPSRSGFALSQTGETSEPFIYRFINRSLTGRNIGLRVAIKAVGGKSEQGGGVFWRNGDRDQYYAAYISSLDGSLRLYKVFYGDFFQIAAKEHLKLALGEWHELGIKHVGNQIECSVDGTKYIEVSNDSIAEGGWVGLWTKADAYTHFDGLRVTDFGPAWQEEKVATRP